MTSTDRGLAELVAAAGAAMLIVSLFLPWASGGGVEQSGWELWTMGDVFLLIVALAALGLALTGGRFGLFRPDMSLRAAADLLGVVATVLLVWLLAFDFPDGATREAGAFLALAGAIAVACGAGDYSVLRGAPLFPRTGDGSDDR
jgi:hypothetical protein